jgi:spore germination cell wall hydrolase CwlJ-like protein
MSTGVTTEPTRKAPATPGERMIAYARQPATWIGVGVIVLLALAMIFLGHRETDRPVPKKPPVAVGEAPPAAEPLVFAPIAADEARKLNDAIPFAKDRGPASRPFAFAGAPESRERAVDCLASAMLYEAGGDARGQQAVAQVVLNRVRHPAYPGTVCGVVFQGSERSTGCQFTFTCDGALHRAPSPGSFALVRERARSMLEGNVSREVGLATHYHTDWVHPIWSAKLEKIAQVDTHLFFRWSGVWGSAAAMRKAYNGMEPIVPALAFLSPFHSASPLATPSATASDGLLTAKTPPPLAGAEDLGGGKFRVAMSPARSANVQALLALDQCGNRDYCKVTGVLDGAVGPSPIVFVYLRNRKADFERVQWDCAVFKRPSAMQCFHGPRDIPDTPGGRDEDAPSAGKP